MSDDEGIPVTRAVRQTEMSEKKEYSPDTQDRKRNEMLSNMFSKPPPVEQPQDPFPNQGFGPNDSNNASRIDKQPTSGGGPSVPNPPLTSQALETMPSAIKFRILLVKIICYLNVLFILLFFPITMARGYIYVAGGIFANTYALVAYIVVALICLFATWVSYEVAVGINKSGLKCWIYVLLFFAIAFLVMGIAVFSMSRQFDVDKWTSMTDTEKLFFDSQQSNFENRFSTNMILIGLFMIIEMLIMVITAFLVFLLLNALASDHYRPVHGPKPFEKNPFIKRRADHVVMHHIRAPPIPKPFN